MELKLVDGDYTAGKYHDLESVTGSEELAQRLMLRLAARRGGLAVLPDYGSRLYTLSSMRPSEREGSARQFVAEALEGEDVVLEDLQLSETEDGLRLELSLTAGGDSLNITTVI